LHAEELRKIYCLENAMGGVSVAGRGKGRHCSGRNKSRFRVDNARTVATQDAVVTADRKQQSCESYGFVAVRLQNREFMVRAWRSRVEGQGVVFVLCRVSQSERSRIHLQVVYCSLNNDCPLNKTYCSFLLTGENELNCCKEKKKETQDVGITSSVLAF
jgi:hypothetical protein